jgi:hypothetical protein
MAGSKVFSICSPILIFDTEAKDKILPANVDPHAGMTAGMLHIVPVVLRVFSILTLK